MFKSEEFSSLPIDIQGKLKDTLRAYDRVDVTFENGEYHWGGLCLKKEYAPDYRVVGTYLASDIFTKEEQIVNYVNSFGSYPIGYDGVRDYNMLREGEESKCRGETIFDMDDNGNIIVVTLQYKPKENKELTDIKENFEECWLGKK